MTSKSGEPKAAATAKAEPKAEPEAEPKAQPKPAAAEAEPKARRTRTKAKPAAVREAEELQVPVTSAAEWDNPLRDPQDRRLPRIAGPSGLVIFGVTGDLSRKKLMPAARPHSTEEALNNTIPVRKTAFRPIRSPSRP
ncbi:hypothetical protein ABZX94_29015, partial [Streptomyces seoulensis]